MLVRYQTIPSLFSEIDELLYPSNSIFHRINFSESTRRVAMKDAGDLLNVVMEIPGVRKEEVKVTLHDGVLTVAAERKQPELKESEQWLRNEISYGKFERSIDLPYPVAEDKISATHENGMLRIVLPKAQEAKPKEISIK